MVKFVGKDCALFCEESFNHFIMSIAKLNVAEIFTKLMVVLAIYLEEDNELHYVETKEVFCNANKRPMQLIRF